MDDHHHSTAVGTQPAHLLHRLPRFLRRERQQTAQSTRIDQVPALDGKRRRSCSMARPTTVNSRVKYPTTPHFSNSSYFSAPLERDIRIRTTWPPFGKCSPVWVLPPSS